MSTVKNSMRREAIRRILAQRAGGAADASAIAEATLSTWRQMTAQLEPLIGVRGADALFSRSLHLTSKAFPSLAIGGNREGGAALLASLKARLEACEAAVATEASLTLLVTFSDLLATLIGEPLTERLLGTVWPISASEQETP
jgi:hypothetical protein